MTRCAHIGCDLLPNAKGVWKTASPHTDSPRLEARRVGPRSANCRARGRTLVGGIDMADRTRGNHLGRTVDERFWEKVDVGHPLGCWEWTGYRRLGEHGMFNAKSGTSPVYAHRWAYEFLMGPIPDGLQLDHLCRNPPCVNPDHLEPVTARENTRRSESLVIRIWRSGTCNRGHPRTPEHLYIRPDNGYRMCRTCERERRMERARKP